MFSTETTTIPAKGQQMIGTGIAIALPPGTYARIAPRSGFAFRHGITTNAGVIDADYRGEVKVLLVNLKEKDYEVKEGGGPNSPIHHRKDLQQGFQGSQTIGRHRKVNLRIRKHRTEKTERIERTRHQTYFSKSIGQNVQKEVIAQESST